MDEYGEEDNRRELSREQRGSEYTDQIGEGDEPDELALRVHRPHPVDVLVYHLVHHLPEGGAASARHLLPLGHPRPGPSHMRWGP